MELKDQRIKLSGMILRYLRKKAGLSQKQVAEQLNIVQSTYAGYENGHHEPNLDTLILLAYAYGVSLDFISGRVFIDWLPDPFEQMRYYGDGHIIDLVNHAMMQYEEMNQISYMVMEAEIHGEYDSSIDDPPTNYRKFLRTHIKAPADAGAQ